LFFCTIKIMTCKFPGCSKWPTFGVSGESPIFCKDHKRPDDLDVRNPYCRFPGCTIRAGFGLPGKLSEFCKKHAPEGYVSKRSRCPFCTKCRLYGFPGGKPMYCRRHAPLGCIDLANHKQLCRFPGCKTRASFGITKAMYCRQHMPPGGTNKRLLKCQKCSSQAIFGKTTPIFCKMHASADCVRLWEKCQAPGCNKRRLYGIFRPEFCKVHALPGDRNISRDGTPMIMIISETPRIPGVIPNTPPRPGTQEVPQTIHLGFIPDFAPGIPGFIPDFASQIPAYIVQAK